MSFTCYTASAGKIQPGIDGTRFPLQCHQGVMPLADIELDLPRGSDSARIGAMLAAGDPAVFSLGEARLEPAKDKKPRKDACLIAVDLKEWWPAEDFGDHSDLVLLSYEGWAIMRSPIGGTCFTKDGQALVWDAGKAPRFAAPASIGPLAHKHAEDERKRLGVITLRLS